MTKAEREMMERIHAYGIILSLDEEQDAEAKLLTGKGASA